LLDCMFQLLSLKVVHGLATIPTDCTELGRSSLPYLRFTSSFAKLERLHCAARAQAI
jgi:hypothetical protein